MSLIWKHVVAIEAFAYYNATLLLCLQYIASAGIMNDDTCNGFYRVLEGNKDPAACARQMMEFSKALLHETAKVKKILV